MRRGFAVGFLALVLTLGSAAFPYRTDERAMYGWEGPVEANWRPRELAGWPAAFLADTPDSSINHKIGPEDDFRLWPFVASFSFWLLGIGGLVRLARRRRRLP